MFEIGTGPEADRKAIERAQSDELLFLQIGAGQKLIPLNGGSDTRKASREYWQEWALARNVEFQSIGGCMVILGSARIVGGE